MTYVAKSQAFTGSKRQRQAPSRALVLRPRPNLSDPSPRRHPTPVNTRRHLHLHYRLVNKQRRTALSAVRNAHDKTRVAPQTCTMSATQRERSPREKKKVVQNREAKPNQAACKRWLTRRPSPTEQTHERFLSHALFLASGPIGRNAAMAAASSSSRVHNSPQLLHSVE